MKAFQRPAQQLGDGTFAGREVNGPRDTFWAWKPRGLNMEYWVLHPSQYEPPGENPEKLKTQLQFVLQAVEHDHPEEFYAWAAAASGLSPLPVRVHVFEVFQIPVMGDGRARKGAATVRKSARKRPTDGDPPPDR